MEVEFDDADFDRLETEPQFDGGWSRGVVKAYRKRMQMIRAAPDERDFYMLNGVRFEQLKGPRKGEFSMRLNDQYRLTLRFKGKGSEKVVQIIRIEDYHE